MTDWRDYDTIYTERYMRTPQNNSEGYRRSSPRFSAADLHGALLLVHGSMDENVHMQNTLQFAYALQQAGKTFDMMIYPKSRHRLGSPDLEPPPPRDDARLRARAPAAGARGWRRGGPGSEAARAALGVSCGRSRDRAQAPPPSPGAENCARSLPLVGAGSRHDPLHAVVCPRGRRTRTWGHSVRRRGTAAVQVRANVVGSAILTRWSIVSASIRVKRSTSRKPPARARKSFFGEKLVVSTTSVSPSQRPRESPCQSHVARRAGAAGRRAV